MTEHPKKIAAPATVRFAILANNGFNYEYVTEIDAASVKAARDWFKASYAGDFRTSDFRVSRR